MRKLLLPLGPLGPLAFLAGSSLLACSFEMTTKGGQPQTPPPPNAAAATPAPAPTPKPTVARMGGLKKAAGAPQMTPAPAGTQPAPAGTQPQPGAQPAVVPPVMQGANAFGSGTPDATGWKGSLFAIPTGSQKIPDLSGTPTGFLFAKELNVASQALTGGFPGVDANRNQDFAIRYEAPLVVNNEADYTFRVVADDGAKLAIDGTPIVDNDGVHAAATEKSGPVHLVKGTHTITVDYFQTTGNVALQLFCKSAAMPEKICPTSL